MKKVAKVSKVKVVKFDKPKKPAKVLLGEGGVTSAGWHSIADAFRCLKAYQFKTVRGIREPQLRTPEPFAVGLMFHAARARWFSRHFKMTQKTLRACYQAMDDEAAKMPLPVSPESIKAAKDLFLAYAHHWGVRVLPTPVAAEYLLGPTPLEPGDKETYWRTARLDDVSKYAEANWKMCIGEAKTTSTSIDECVREYELHGQPMLQAVLYKLDPGGEAKFGPIAGIILDVAKKGWGSERPSFGRVFLQVDQHAVDWYVKSFKHKLRQVAKIDWDTDVPRNVTGCTFMAGRARVDCTYKDLCRFGKSATSKYVLPEGASMHDASKWKGETPPWE